MNDFKEESELLNTLGEKDTSIQDSCSGDFRSSKAVFRCLVRKRRSPGFAGRKNYQRRGPLRNIVFAGRCGSEFRQEPKPASNGECSGERIRRFRLGPESSGEKSLRRFV